VELAVGTILRLAFEICLVSNHLGMSDEFGMGKKQLQEGYLSKSPLLAEAHLLQQGEV